MRRTKEEAAQTRAAIVDSALACFDRHGIAGTTLDQIAAAAGVTKGAVYHHFGSKRAIFHEVRERVALPLLDEADTDMLHAGERPALERIEHFLLGFLGTMEEDARTRRALGVMQFKCEYVDALAAELRDAMRNNGRMLKAFEAAYGEARRRGELVKGIAPRAAALETLMFLTGLVRQWLLHPPAHAVRREARAAIRAHVALRSARRNA
jgi:AcrR family transcriptional regulator